jgi:hypothetical protein
MYDHYVHAPELLLRKYQRERVKTVYRVTVWYS